MAAAAEAKRVAAEEKKAAMAAATEERQRAAEEKKAAMAAAAEERRVAATEKQTAMAARATSVKRPAAPKVGKPPRGVPVIKSWKERRDGKFLAGKCSVVDVCSNEVY
jgi:hypothetical protein